MSKTVGYENLFIVKGNNKRTGSETRLKIIGTDRINGTWKAKNTRDSYIINEVVIEKSE
jgi:hypothetical protein